MTTPAFVTAMLLTRSPQRAEAAVLEAIESAGTPDAILPRTIEAALARPSTPPAEDLVQAAAMLPEELRRVLELPPPLARVFILRTLIGLTKERVGQMLNLKPAQVDDQMQSAYLALAGLSRTLDERNFA